MLKARMYEDFFGLRERPFDLTPDPRFLLLTDSHREALGNLEYGISARKGITVLTGEAGTGKTTLIRTAFGRAETGPVGQPIYWAYLKNPRLRESEFIEFLASRFGLSAGAAESKTRMLDELEAKLTADIPWRAGHRRGPRRAAGTARRSPAAGEHRVQHRQAVADHPGRAAGAGRPPQRDRP